MKHFTKSEWQSFVEKKLSKPELEIMENHLLECEQCINQFLEINYIYENTRIDYSIPPNFSRRTMAFINHNQLNKSESTVRRGKKGRLLSYYAAAAAVTLMLVSQGAFQITPGNVTRIFASSVTVEKTDNIIYTWPNRLLEKSFNWKSLFTTDNIKLKEVIR